MVFAIMYLPRAHCVQGISSTASLNALIVRMPKTVRATMPIPMAARVIDIILLRIHA